MIHDNPKRTRGPFPAGRSDVYTLLLVIAAVALVVGLGFVWYRSTALFETSNPFQVVSKSALDWVATLHL